MLLDADRGEAATHGDAAFDVCICGAGPAGITLATALAAMGHRVALLEAGGIEPTDASRALYQGEIIGLPYYPLDVCRLRYLGGTSNHWGGYTRPLDARDFAPLAVSPLNAWPIAKSDLDPYVARTEQILELAPPVVPWDLFAGRSPSLQPSAYRINPVRFGPKYRNELERSDRITLILNANLVDIDLDDGLGAVRSVAVRGYTSAAPVQLRARLFALCCGGLENARILLNANRQAPAGLGNGHDMVGRTFCDHIELPVGRVLLRSPLPSLTFGIASDAIMAKHNCLSFEIELEPMARQGAVCAQPFETRLRLALEKPDDACFDAVLHIVIGQKPHRDSRVTLTEAKDRFGQRLAALDWQLTDLDARTFKLAAEETARELARLDVGRVRLDDWMADSDFVIPVGDDAGGASHHMGTTRMSDDPALGVVNRDGRVHGLDNLYVGGSSVFSSPGVSNPTYTIVQLALRLADHLSGRLA